MTALTHREREGGRHPEPIPQIGAERGRGRARRGIFGDVADGERLRASTTTPSARSPTTWRTMTVPLQPCSSIRTRRSGGSNENASNLSLEATATTGCRLPANAWASGIRGSRSARLSPRRVSSRSATSGARSDVYGSTLVKPADRRPVASLDVSTSTTPAAVSKTKAPSPSASASATAVAMVACPQNGTSAPGEKYRTASRRPARSPTNADSGCPTSAAMRCMSAAVREVASRTTPAGLPPPGWAANAENCRMSGESVMRPFSRGCRERAHEGRTPTPRDDATGATSPGRRHRGADPGPRTTGRRQRGSAARCSTDSARARMPAATSAPLTDSAGW